ncbi:MAG: hypothetical protein KC535_05715, partial [Nanoarchaeota archaeon]|nr:hypothetical protein [Nanoarchaeota archaeon]
YRSLLIAGTVSAKELSLGCEVPLTAIYPNLNSLEKKGLVKRYTGEVTRFQALRPSVALDNLVKKQAEQMQKAKEELVIELSSLPQKEDSLKSPIDLSLGTEASISVHDEFARTSKSSLYIAGMRFGSKRSIFPFLHNITHAKEKGLDVRIIVIARNERTELLAKECQHKEIPLRYLDMDNFSIVVSDENECKLTLKNRSLRERVNLRITDHDLVKGMKDYFLVLWSRAKAYN